MAQYENKTNIKANPAHTLNQIQSNFIKSLNQLAAVKFRIYYIDNQGKHK